MKLSMRLCLLLSSSLLIILAGIIGCTSLKKTTVANLQPVTGKQWQLPLISNKTIAMEWIPAGTFTMGSSITEVGRKKDEGPETVVTLTTGYWLGKTELTVGMWKGLTDETVREHVTTMLHDENVYDFGTSKKTLNGFMNFNIGDEDKIMPNENDSMPMYFVSWDNAMEMCKNLTASEKAKGRLTAGYEYTLPTEAQWEYACRAGTTTETFAGQIVMDGKTAAVLNEYAWYVANNAINYQGRKLGKSGGGPRNTGEKKPNQWGLQDMSGNIWEWCRDWYGPHPGGAVTDPTGPANGIGRVNKGGSFGNGARECRSATRASNPQPEKSAYRGFRMALCAVQ